MNTGLQDAYNLAWKLALVVSHRAEPSLLDSYEGERLPEREGIRQTLRLLETIRGELAQKSALQI